MKTFTTLAQAEDARRRIEVLRASIADAERKKAGITHAIQCRQTTVQRLEAQLAMRGESGSARARDE